MTTTTASTRSSNWKDVWLCGVCDAPFSNRNDREIHKLKEDHILVSRETTVVNVKTDEFDVYIGRNPKYGNTRWGNPIKITEDVTREQAVAEYAKWIEHQPYLLEQLPSLRGMRLGCHCAPQACHGDVLAQLANRLEVKDVDITCIICGETKTFPYDTKIDGLRIDVFVQRYQANICSTCRPDTFVMSGTGARDFPLNSQRFTQLAEEVKRIKAKYPKLAIMSGGATGFDEGMAQLAIGHQIPLILVIPNRQYPDKYWGDNGKDLARLAAFHKMEDAAQCVIYLTGSPTQRNVHMVQFADAFWVDKQRALDNQSRSNGTRHCYNCIAASNKPYKFID